MSVEVRIETRGIDALARGLDAQRMQSLLQRAGLEAEGLAKASAPVDTGFLRSSLRSDRATPIEVSIGASAEYAAYVEMGTKRREGRPYLQPAIQKASDHLRDVLEQLMRKAAG